MKDFNLITSANHLNEYTNCQQQQQKQKLNKSTADIMPIGSSNDPMANSSTLVAEYASTRDKLMQQHTQDLTKHILNNQQQSMTLQHNYIKSFQPASHQHSILKQQQQQHTAILDDRLYNNTMNTSDGVNYPTATLHRFGHGHHNQVDNNIYLANPSKPMINMQTLNHQYISQSTNNQAQTNTNRLQSTFGQHHSLDLTSRNPQVDPLTNSQLEQILINQQQRVLDNTYGLIDDNNLNSNNLHTNNNIANNCENSNYAMPQVYDVVPLNQNGASNHLNQHLHQSLNMKLPSQISNNGLIATTNNNNCGVMTADSGIESIQSYLSQVSDHSGGNDDNSGDNGDNNSNCNNNSNNINNNSFNVDNNNDNLDDSSLYHVKHQDHNQHNSQSTYNRSVIPRSNSNKILTNCKDGLFNEVGVIYKGLINDTIHLSHIISDSFQSINCNLFLILTQLIGPYHD